MKNIIKTLLVVMTLALVLVAFTACDLTAFFGCQHEGGTATCTELAICDKCGEAYGEYGHVAIKLPATPATCSKPGMTSGSYCKNCDAVIVEQKETPKLDHEWVPNEFKDKTCSTDGVEGGNHCANCGIRDENTKVLEASHEFGEYYVALEPTCGEDGYYARKCEDCGTVERGDDIPATGEHSFTVDVPEKAPTCAEAGHTACKACEVCGAPNEDYAEIPATEDHEFNPDEIFVAVPPTETEHGMTAGYCTKCGNGYYLDYVHVYENGACKICGAADPATVVEYYLIGYINGADYGCNNDYANLGEYKFVDGKLTVTFTQDSYVFIKSANSKGENKDWFMASAYTQEKQVTLANTTTGTAEKMWVPGNVEITFTLTVNEDGTLTLVAEYTK